VGCGSLRAGRLFICYLDEGRYFGIEPNKWLIKDAIANQVGKHLMRIKKPRFDHNTTFDTGVFSTQFDFIVAQSIFSHAGGDLIQIALQNFKKSLKPTGLIVVTFIEAKTDFEGSGWVYPGCVNYQPSTILRFGEEAGLFVSRLPWYHPRQSWWLLAKEKERLPNEAMMRHLSGAVLFDPEFRESWESSSSKEEAKPTPG
jgi:SAM-dependent methyltransferase